jgi:tRNA threonylcarbamoyladenosine biosynthesis protein TsaE
MELGRALGSAISGSASTGITVLLSGDLGTGKTALARGIGGALGVKQVRSPSFTLINEYSAPCFNVAHADLYRLEPDGVEDLGLEEYRDSSRVLLVEWPERWKNMPEGDTLEVFIEAVSENERFFDISSLGSSADLVLHNLREAINNGKTDPGAGLQSALD